ncbi:MAG: T9SS type A sorting domain-containing protein [Chitinophagaceae bacterium]|nr:T9SS type A sorting domain-containing protein [Chitinophagaceae bacterium]
MKITTLNPSLKTVSSMAVRCIVATCSLLTLSFSLSAQTINTAAGTVNWTLTGNGNGIQEVSLERGVSYHGDGFDNALTLTVSGNNISFTNTYHFSQTYGAAIQHIAVTNNSPVATTFSLVSTSNLGSDYNTRFHYASSTPNRYTISSDNASSTANGSDPVISLIFGNAALNYYTTTHTYTSMNDNISFGMYDVPIPAGQTRRILFIVGVGNITNSASNRPDQAYVAVQDLLAGNWPADFTSFLTNQQKGQVLNWTELSTLPVTWGDFTAKSVDQGVKLNWNTMNESNTKNFVIQHSTDGIAWNNVGSVQAAGQSSQNSYYSFTHTQAVAGNNFYRIQQNDNDGRHSYSKNLKITKESLQVKWKLLQNPVQGGAINVQMSAPTSMSLYNSSGKLVWEKLVQSGIQKIETGNQPSGIYFLKGANLTERILIK